LGRLTWLNRLSRLIRQVVRLSGLAGTHGFAETSPIYALLARGLQFIMNARGFRIQSCGTFGIQNTFAIDFQKPVAPALDVFKAQEARTPFHLHHSRRHSCLGRT